MTLLERIGRRSGVDIAIAVDSTALGPALGGCRMWPYPTREDAVADAVRLSGAMTLKAAAAGLRLGGGKAVIRVSPGPRPAGPEREKILRDLADAVNELDGRYITAEDVGTTSADMEVLARSTRWVVGRPGGSGDPAPFTAAGVGVSIRACLRHLYGSPDVAGRSVAVVGLGAVGSRLARELSAAGAELVLADVDPSRPGNAGVHEALRAAVDVLAPCAMGGVIDTRLVDELRCRIICGAANNQLADDGLAERLAERRILWAPDFIVNAGGLINVAMELDGYDAELAMARALDLERVVGRVLRHAEGARITPLAAARWLAERRLGSVAPVAA